MLLSGPDRRWCVLGLSSLLATCAVHGGTEVRADPRPAPATAVARTPADAAPIVAEPRALPAPEALEEPLAGFHRALEQTRRTGQKTRVLFFGDSHTASDCMTGRLRERLQADYGDGGPGFLMAAKPWRFFHHGRMEIRESSGLKASFIRKRPEGDPLPLGLSGVALGGGETEPISVRLRVTGALVPTGRVLHQELWFWRRPAGATLQLLLDGAALSPVVTAGEPGPGYLAFDVPDDGAHDLELRGPAQAQVTLFGFVAELEGAGVVVDTLGIPGARARAQLYWEPGLFREHVQRRTPDLWVLAYGTNESTDVTQPIEEYVARLRLVMAQLRELAPRASCLLVGPTDFPERVQKHVYQERERTAEINRFQREISAENGCAYFDTIRAMGGPLSMLDWAKREPPLGGRDLIHLTRQGYAVLGDAIADSILPGQPQGPRE